jgi:integrase
MGKSRGSGLVYQPMYIDKRTGERKRASTWWIQYSVEGVRFRESSKSHNRREAEAFLRQRLEAALQGEPAGPQIGKTTLEDLAESVLDDYRTKGRRTVSRVEDAIAHLRQFFGKTSAGQVNGELVARYVRSRREEGAASATINRELAVLRRAFGLAQLAGRLTSRPHISMLPEGNRREVFLEGDEYQAVLNNLPEYLRPVIQTAYVTGWRINSEILMLQKRHVDLDSGCLRLEPTETREKRERRFPLTPELREVLTRQVEETAGLERMTGRTVPWLFHREGRQIKDFRKAWTLACQRAGVAGKVPDDLRRTAVRNLERAGVSRSAAMAMVGHRSESIYRGIAMVDDVMLKESAAKLAALHQSGKTREGSIPN